MTRKQRHLMIKTAADLIEAVRKDVEGDNPSDSRLHALIYLNSSYTSLVDTICLFRTPSRLEGVSAVNTNKTKKGK